MFLHAINGMHETMGKRQHLRLYQYTLKHVLSSCEITINTVSQEINRSRRTCSAYRVAASADGPDSFASCPPSCRPSNLHRTSSSMHRRTLATHRSRFGAARF